MKPWILYAGITVVAWGVLGVFSKLASNYTRPRQTLLFQVVGVMAFGLVVLSLERFHIDWSPQGFGWSVGAGFVNFVGFLAFFAAVEKGKVSTVIAMSSLYPVVTIALSVLFLHEKITTREGLGVACALLAGFLLAGGCDRWMRDYSTYSFWLEDIGESLTPRPALKSSTDVDVAILGGGYSGLWTAYYLLRQEPALRIAVVDKEIAGFGASGRNGGWCSPNFPVTAGTLEKRFGAETARDLLLTMRASVDEVGRVCAEEKIDARFHKGGILTLARGQHQLASIRSSYAAYERLGLGERYQVLNATEAAERIRVTDVHGGLYTPDGASLHPARLVRGLARAVEARGGVIYERTPVTEFKPGSLITPAGELRAQRAIVLAGESYLTRFSRLHRALLPVYSLISLTTPLTPEQWSQIGWQGGESVSSMRNTVVYLTRTSDGRIL